MANEEHVNILRQGAVVWNKWREENPEVQPDLIEADLRREQLRKANLRQALLTGARLTRVILTEANLQDSDLSRAELHWADLANANLQRAILSNADLREAVLRKAKMRESKLDGADLSNANLQGADLYQAKLNGVKLNNAGCMSTNLEGVDLTNAIVQNANLSGAKLVNAKLDGADFTKTQLNTAVLREASVKGTKFYSASLYEAELRGVKLAEADLSEADLTRAIIDEVSLRPGQLNERQWIQLGVSGKFSSAEKDKQQKEQKSQLDESQYGGEEREDSEDADQLISEVIDGQKRLLTKFKEFLVTQKGVPENELVEERVWVDAIRPLDIDVLFIREGDKTLAIIEYYFFESNLKKPDREQKLLKKYKEQIKLEDCPAYIACLAPGKKGRLVDIYRVTKSEQPVHISNADFPTYEELRRKIGTKTEASVGEGSELGKYRQNFMLYLSRNKGYRKNSMMGEGSWQESGVLLYDVRLKDPESGQMLAVIEVNQTKEGELYVRENSELTERARGLGVPLYVLGPDVLNSSDEYGIQLVTEKGDLEYIAIEDFPAFKKLAGITDDRGSDGDLTSEPDDPSGFKKLCESLDPVSRQIVERGKEIALSIPEYIIPTLTTSCLIFAMLESVESKDVHCETLDFLSKRIPGPEALETLNRIRKAYLKSLKENYRIEVTEEAKRDEPYVTTYVVEVLKLAKKYAVQTTDSDTIFCRHLLAALITYKPKGRKAGVRQRLEDLGISIDSILKDYPEHLKQFKEDDQEEWERILQDVEDERRGEAGEISQRVVDVVGNVATIRIEGIGEKDRLGRDKLVRTLAGMFALTECDNGFTMALLGDWGQGKSTVMGLLQTELEEKHKGKFEFAKYNAWEYEKTENVSAGIAQEVVKGLTGEMGEWERIVLRVKFAWREHNEELRRLLIMMLLAVDVALISLNVVLLLNEISSLYKIIPAIFGLSAISLPLISFKDLKKIFEHPLSTQLQTYLKLPDYGEHLGLVPVLKRHIKTLWDFQLDEQKKLIVYVDDLDRCNVDHIVKVLDAIRLVMTIPNVIVMIGIDHRIAFKAIGKHYEELADGNDSRGAGEIARDYLGKIIQLPLRLRAASYGELRDYVFEKLFDKKNIVDDTKSEEPPKTDVPKEPVAHKKPIPPADTKLTENLKAEKTDNDKEQEAAAAVEGSDEKIAEAIKDKASERSAFYELVGKFEFSNPRQLLRLHNSFRFLKGYGRGKGEGYDTLDMLKMLFWQEFLHNWPLKVRGRCMATLIDEVHAEKVKPIVARRVLNDVRDDIVQLFNGENYAELAEFVRIVVLPHNEEGIFDTKEEIDEWLKKEKEEEEEQETQVKSKKVKGKKKKSIKSKAKR